MSPRPHPGATRLWQGSAAALAALLSPVAAWSQTLSLNDGETVAGVVTGYHDRLLAFRGERIGTIAVAPEAIVDLKAQGRFAVVTTDERLLANGLQAGRDGVIAQTRFGALTLRWAEVVGIEPLDNEPGAAAEPAAAPAPHEPRNRATLGLSIIGNELSSFFGVSRSTLVTAELGYARRIGSSSEVSIRLPIFHQSSRETDLDGDHYSRGSGIGDLTLSATRRVSLPAGWPQLQLRVTAGVPTGRAAGPDATTLLGLSSGNWSAGGELSINMPLLGGTLVGGLGYTRYWPKGGGEGMEDKSWAYGFSTDLDQSRRITFSMTGSQLRQGSSTTSPAYAGISIDQMMPGGITVSPSFAHGMNADAQDYLIGLSVSKSW